jgi:hypothetical protein
MRQQTFFSDRHLLGGLLSSVAASAQTQASPPSAVPPPAAVQPEAQNPSDREREDFRKSMISSFPGKGCFEAKYRNKTWQPVLCGPAPTKPNPLVALQTRPNQVGAGNDYFAVITGNISSATGSFDSVSGVNAVYSPTDTNNPMIVYPDSYTLQLNANQFPTQACNNVPNCMGWEQFIFSQRSDCGAPCVYIEYWLLNYPSPCPAGGPGSGWIFFAPTSPMVCGCFLNTTTSAFPAQPVTVLGQLKLTGSAGAGGGRSGGGPLPQGYEVAASTSSNLPITVTAPPTPPAPPDQAILQTASGDLIENNQDSLLDLAKSWSEAEFNLFGDCCAFEAFLNSSLNLTVRLEVDNGTTNTPQCQNGSTFATAETNNLDLGTCSPVGGASPAIVFTESGGGPLPPGYTVGGATASTGSASPAPSATPR